MSSASPGPRRPVAFLRFALCKDSGLKGLVVRGELKLGLRECCRPFMTEVCLWCRFEARRCKPVSMAIVAAFESPSGIVGCAEGVLEEGAFACEVLCPCMFLPLVTDWSRCWLFPARLPARWP